jgi:hypothetical protein
MQRYLRIVIAGLVLATPTGAQIRVSPATVNVNTQDATTVFLSYGGLRADQRLADAVWCGHLVSAAPALGSKCDPSLEWGQLPLRFDHATQSGANGAGFTDIMSIPPSIARRAYQAAARGASANFFYVRHIVSMSGLPDEFVVVVCRLASGGASVPLSLTDVRVTAGEQSVVFVQSREAPPTVAADIRYTGTGRLVGRWEVVRPGEELPADDDLLTAATLPLELRAKQRRYTEVERFNVYLPPSGRATLPGPSPRRLPVDVDGTYLLLLRVEASADDADNSNLSDLGTGDGVVPSGAVAGFPMPVLRYVVGVSSENAGVLETRRANAVRLLLPRAADSLSVDSTVTFGWIEQPSASFYRLEITRDDDQPIHSAIIARGLGTYRGPPWLADRATGHALRWRVVALDARGKDQMTSEWRPIVVRR